MAISVGSGSVWKSLTDLKVGVGSVWKQAENVWVGVGGVWKNAWTRINAQAIGGTIQDGDALGGAVQCFIEYRAAGTVYKSEGFAASSYLGDWLLIGANTDFQIRLTGTGDPPSMAGSSALNTWLPMNVLQVWGWELSGLGLEYFSGTIEIRRVSDSVVVSSAGLIASIESTF